jgi:hypothetical protein
MSPDGSDRKVIVTGGHLPDGIAVDAAAGHIYWTNMGVPNLDDGSGGAPPNTRTRFCAGQSLLICPSSSRPSSI